MVMRLVAQSLPAFTKTFIFAALQMKCHFAQVGSPFFPVLSKCTFFFFFSLCDVILLWPSLSFSPDKCFSKEHLWSKVRCPINLSGHLVHVCDLAQVSADQPHQCGLSDISAVFIHATVQLNYLPLQANCSRWNIQHIVCTIPIKGVSLSANTSFFFCSDKTMHRTAMTIVYRADPGLYWQDHATMHKCLNVPNYLAHHNEQTRMRITIRGHLHRGRTKMTRWNVILKSKLVRSAMLIGMSGKPERSHSAGSGSERNNNVLLIQMFRTWHGKRKLTVSFEHTLFEWGTGWCGRSFRWSAGIPCEEHVLAEGPVYSRKVQRLVVVHPAVSITIIHHLW